MKTTYQTIKSPVYLLGLALLFIPVLCLVAPGEQQLSSGVSFASCDDSCCTATCSDLCCSECCEAICCPKQVEKEVKKHCWKVEPKLVCIPSFRWPWQQRDRKSPDCGDGCSKCCSPLYGQTRCVNVLEKHEYDCVECGYEWEVKCIRCKTKNKISNKCCCPSCGCKSTCDL